MKAKIIDECLEAISEGQLTEENCLNRYPALKNDLMDVFFVVKLVKEFDYPELSSLKKGQNKNNLLFKLADRNNDVTKPLQVRYRWQNMKRRFSMSWIIIVTTILSLISGTGVVYASNSSLPGETLYPLKTWVEEAQLTLAPDSLDVFLLKKFSNNRIIELIAMDQAGNSSVIDALLENYQNKTESMMGLIARIKVKNPDEAIRLRAEIDSQLREHARIIEEHLLNYEESDPQIMPLRAMLQTNSQTRLRINEEPLVEEPPTLEEIDSEPTETPEVLPDPQFQNQNQNRVIDLPEELLEDGVLKFRFRFEHDFTGFAFAEVDGKFYDCMVNGDDVICDLTGVPGNGKLNLYQKDSNLLLYSFEFDHDYNYLWEGTKESGGTQTQDPENPERGKGASGNGQGGRK